MKLQRTYQMMVTGRSGLPVYVRYPLTLSFSVTKHIFSGSSSANFSLYNLNKANRNEILFDEATKERGYPITLNAGYDSNDVSGPAIVTSTVAGSPGARAAISSLPQIFNGFVKVAYTERSGGDLITRINALVTGDITSEKPTAYFPSNFVIKAGTSFVGTVKTLMRLLGSVSPGEVVVTPTPAVATRDRVFTGMVWNALQELTPPGGNVFIENGRCNMLGQKDTMPGSNNLAVLKSSTGLLNIPKYNGYTVECSCVFEPSIAIGNRITLQSDFLTEVNKHVYKVREFTHRGTISGSESGEAVTEMSLYSVDAPDAPGAQ